MAKNDNFGKQDESWRQTIILFFDDISEIRAVFFELNTFTFFNDYFIFLLDYFYTNIQGGKAEVLICSFSFSPICEQENGGHTHNTEKKNLSIIFPN